MNNIKKFKIEINGIQESIDAVDKLNKQLGWLEEEIDKLSKKSVNVKASGSGGGSKSSSTSSLSEEERLAKQIEQIDSKREAYSKEIYQNYLAAKDVLKETVTDQKAIAASERLQADAYSNTMMGMKQKLADIKAAMQTVDLNDTDTFKKMTNDANELNQKLLEIEKSYGQFGRQVGNYPDATKSLQAITVTINGVEREFGSAREATKTLNNELKAMAVNGKQNTKEYEELRQKLLELESTMNDAKKPMDGIMDAMESFTAIASATKGISAFFGIDDTEIQKSVQQLLALQTALKGIQTIQKQMQTREGIGKIFAEGNKAIDEFVSKITGAEIGVNGLTKATKLGTYAVKGLSMALKGIGIGVAFAAVTMLIDGLQTIIKSLDTAKVKTDSIESSVKALNRQYENRKDLLAGSYLNNALTTEQYLAEQYKLENDYISEQISLLQQRQQIINTPNAWGKIVGFFSSGVNNGNFTGNKLTGNTTVESVNQLGSFSYDVKSIDEAREAWKKLNKAYLEVKDYFSEYGESLSDWWSSLYTTVVQTEDVMHGMGNIVLSNTIGEFQELQNKFNNGKISADEFAVSLKELANNMNSDEVLNSVIANLDKYIPDEEVREKVENILKYIGQLNDQFNAVSEAQIHHWNQVKIDAMEEGAKKIAAQMAENERHEIAQYGHTQEQISLIKKKYERLRLNKQNEYNNKAQSETKKNQREQLEAEKDLANLRIANMKEGLNKVLKQLEEERKQRIAKVVADGKLVNERRKEIDVLYDKKIEDAKKKWAENIEKTYRNMWDKIYSYSEETTKKIASLAEDSSNIGAQNLEYKRSDNQSFAVASYGVQGKNNLAQETLELLGFENDYTMHIGAIYQERIYNLTKYWDERKQFEINALEETNAAKIKVENENYNKERRDNLNHLHDMEADAEKALSARTITQEKYDEIRLRLADDFQQREIVLEKQHKANLEKIEQEKTNSIQKINQESYADRLQEMRDFQTAIANLESKQPVKNAWGIVNLKETNKNNQELLDSYEDLATSIRLTKEGLQDKLNKKEISFDTFQNATRELDAFSQDVGEKMEKVKYELSIGGQIEQVIEDVQQYVQALGQGLQQILSAVWSAQDTQFDNEQRELDKMNDALQKALDNNEEILERHKQNVNDIEGELSTARGDRREHLIDQLNAEIEAERRAAAEKKRLQKEQEALERKEEALDKKRQEAQYKRELANILVSGALAAVNAYATKPFVPVGLAMGSLSLGLTAAQYAIAKANPPKFANGGLLEGKSHAQGGIRAGGVELEGNEYVINKHTTMQNIDLLEYINSNRRKLNISDLIDFYQGDRPRKAVQGIKHKFADGGALPTLRTDIEIGNSLTAAFQEYAKHDTVVQVVDIVDKTKQYNNVRVLAGLSE